MLSINCLDANDTCLRYCAYSLSLLFLSFPLSLSLSLSLSLFLSVSVRVMCVACMSVCLSVCLCVCVALSLWATLCAPDLVSHSLSNTISLHLSLLFFRLATALERRLGYGVLASVRLSTDQDSGRSKVRTYVYTYRVWTFMKCSCHLNSMEWKNGSQLWNWNEIQFLISDFSINDLLRHISQLDFVIYWNIFCSS